MPLVHDFVPIDHGFEPVTAWLLAGGRAEMARRLGLDRLSDITAAGVGAARFHAETVVIPVQLSGRGAPFARLEGDLRVERVTPRHTHLTFTGSYDTDSLSRRDVVVSQRLTESWVRAFLTKLAGSVSANGESPVSP